MTPRRPARQGAGESFLGPGQEPHKARVSTVWCVNEQPSPPEAVVRPRAVVQSGSDIMDSARLRISGRWFRPSGGIPDELPFSRLILLESQ